MLAIFAMLLPTLAAAQEGGGIDDRINEIFADYTGWDVSPIFADLPGTNFSWIALWWSTAR